MSDSELFDWAMRMVAVSVSVICRSVPILSLARTRVPPFSCRLFLAAVAAPMALFCPPS